MPDNRPLSTDFRGDDFQPVGAPELVRRGRRPQHRLQPAARLSPRPVIASLGFHLGPEVQMQSVAKGYNQRVEDEFSGGQRTSRRSHFEIVSAPFARASSATSCGRSALIRTNRPE